MKSSKSLYEKRWDRQRKGKFWDYERNRTLPEFFPPTKGEKLLDLACGDGMVSEFFAERGYKVSGIDISKNAISKALRLKIGKFRVGDIDQGLPYKTSFFDIVFWGDGIEHVFDPEGILREVRSVLKKGGRIVISTPNTSFWRYRLHYFKTGEIALTEGHQTEPWLTGHIRFFNIKVLSSLLHETGFRLIKVRSARARKPDVSNYLSSFWPNFFASIIVVEAHSKR